MSEEFPELSIIVVTLESRDKLPLWNHLKDESLDRIEVIVRDDPGICKARNEGVRRANSDKIVFIDDDAIPCEGYVDRVINLLDVHSAVAGRVVDTGHNWVEKTHFHYDQGDRQKITNQIVGCNMAFDKVVFESVGYFDESIQWGHDEREFADRLMREFDIIYAPQLCVYHPYATSVLDYARKRYRLGIADVYYWQKRGQSVPLSIMKSVLSPTTYFDNTLRGSIVKLPTGFAKGMGQVMGYLRQRGDGEVFG